jgi:hypothetical protein
VGATAVALSPRAREIARKGAVYGLAGTLKAGDILYSTASGAVRGAQSAVAGDSSAGARPAAAQSRSDGAGARSGSSRTRKPAGQQRKQTRTAASNS